LSRYGFPAFYAACLLVIAFERGKTRPNFKSELDRRYLQSRLETTADGRGATGTRWKWLWRKLSKDERGSRIFVMMDLDNFKQINDGGGQTGGTSSFGTSQDLKSCCGKGFPSARRGRVCCFSKTAATERPLKPAFSYGAELKRWPGALPGVAVGASSDAQYSAGMTVSQLVRKGDTAPLRAKRVKNEFCVCR
jgi:hypothetical protein